jgi:phosphoribosylformylglycinamidine synthase
MMFKARVEISLKRGHIDPEGETTARLLRELGYAVESVNVSKVFNIFFRADSKGDAEDQVEEMCRRLLANPTKDNYTYTIEEVK